MTSRKRNTAFFGLCWPYVEPLLGLWLVHACWALGAMLGPWWGHVGAMLSLRSAERRVRFGV